MKITRNDAGEFEVDCAACGLHEPQPPYKLNRTSAEEKKRCHQCRVES